MKSKQREVACRQRHCPGSAVAVNILPRQEAAADPHCPMPELSVLLLEGAGLTQRILPLRLSLFLYFILNISTYYRVFGQASYHLIDEVSAC